MDLFFSGSDVCKLCSSYECVIVRNDGAKRKRNSGRMSTRGGRYIPMDALEKCLSQPMSDANGVLDDRMEGRRNWRLKDGSKARFILYGVLLVDNVVDICPWRDEFGLDSGTVNFCSIGKSCSKGAVDWKGLWSWIGDLGSFVTFEHY